MVKYIHFRLRSPKGCDRFRTKDVGRKGHTKITLCLYKPRKGEKAAKGRKYESEVQRILVKKGTRTFDSDIKKAEKIAEKTCKRHKQKLVKVNSDYKCK